MLAFAGELSPDVEPLAAGLSARLAASLCAGIGGEAGYARVGPIHAAYRPMQARRGAMRGWRPARTPGGRVALFHGFLDNAAELADELGTSADDLAELYGRAVDAWGAGAEQRMVGEFCAIVYDEAARSARLARSHLRAPPLRYTRHNGSLVAASVPRAIFAAGVTPQLNEQRVADSAFLNLTDQRADWYLGLARVPMASVVTITADDVRCVKYYDILALPPVRLPRLEDYVERASVLLDEAVAKALAGSRSPGVTLSSGLDSPQLAVRALRHVPEGRRLPSFTFVTEPGWDGITPKGANGDERAMVEAFVALHPQLDPRFTNNDGSAQDYRWPEMFHAMGCAPAGLGNMYPYHGLWRLAREAGCDRVLIGEWGNYTFSEQGDWGFVEYFLNGRWRELWIALRRHQNDPRSMLRKFIALSLVPLLPDRAWTLMKKIWHPREKLPLALISPLRAEYRASAGVDDRARSRGFLFDRYQPRSARRARAQMFANVDGEGAEIYQGFEQLYGIEQRDPFAYRPFVEFCLGLSTDLFLRDGEGRWLAKQLARGMMPDEQRINRLNGRWDADWHVRIGRKRVEWRASLEAIARDPRLGAMIDTERLIAALDRFPERTSTDPGVSLELELGVPFALIAARFIDYVEGSNRV